MNTPASSDGASSNMRGAVLVAMTGTSQTRHAAHLGAEFARLLGTSLVFGSVAAGAQAADTPGGVTYGLTQAERKDFARIQGRMLALGTASDLNASVEVVVAGSPAEGLARLVARRSPSIIVIGAPQSASRDREAPLDAGWPVRLLHRTSCPIVMVPSEQDQDHPAAYTAEAIGIRWDYSREADAALTAGLDLAVKAKRPVKVFHHAGPAAPAPAGAAGARTDRVDQDSRESVRKRISSVLRRRSVPTDVSIEICDGDAADTLIAASERLHLLVVGAPCDGPMRRISPGSVVEDLSSRSRCPVLVVPRGATLRVTSRRATPAHDGDAQQMLATRIDRLHKAMAALSDVIGRVPDDEPVPQPMRLALGDFATELHRLEREQTYG